MRLTLAVMLLAAAEVMDQAWRAQPNIAALWLAFAILAFAFTHLVDLAAHKEAARGAELVALLEEPQPFREWAWPKRGEWTP